MGIYIRGIGAVSIQSPLSEEGIFHPQTYAEPQVRCMEPDFRKYLDPMVARRMSRIIKRAVISSVQAIEESGINMPDAVISGTGLGCVEDTEKFLDAMARNGEQCLQPTFFIQSTHNTISSQIAIRLKCHGYNNTHVHRGISFESALQETQLLFECGRIRTALVGGYDELTPAYFRMLGRLGYWRPEVKDSLQIISQPDAGSFAGEGSVCFMLSDQPGNSAYARLDGCGIFYGKRDVRQALQSFLERCDVVPEEIDVVMTGKNGDMENDRLYDEIDLLPGKPEIVYKSLCGEFFTAPAYGMYVASVCLRGGVVPAHLSLSGKALNGVRRILLFQHWQGKDYSFILLSSCGD